LQRFRRHIYSTWRNIRRWTFVTHRLFHCACNRFANNSICPHITARQYLRLPSTVPPGGRADVRRPYVIR
jgi:hypothetical protein